MLFLSISEHGLTIYDFRNMFDFLLVIIDTAFLRKSKIINHYS